MEKGIRSGRFKHPAILSTLGTLCWRQALPYQVTGDEFKIIPEASLALAITVVYTSLSISSDDNIKPVLASSCSGWTVFFSPSFYAL
jgi:hypothetical protein